MKHYIKNLPIVFTRLSLKNRTILFLIIFFISRLVYFVAFGIHLNGFELNDTWQLLDVKLLKTELLKSLFYLHCQPPLYNLCIGIILKIFGDFSSFVINFIYMILGFSIYIILFELQIRLNVPKFLAFLLSTIFIISPEAILYENWLFYTYPLTFLLLLSTLFIFCFIKTNKDTYLVLTFISLMLLTGARSIFHLVWLILISVFIIYLAKNRKKAIAAASITVLLVFSMYLKNQLLFGKFTTSTWLGMNFWELTINQLPDNVRSTLISEGKLSNIALIPRFEKPEKYPQSYFNVKGFDGIAALKKIRKSTGDVNFNHFGWIAISDQYLRDERYVLLNYPQWYFRGLIGSFSCYFVPASNHFGVTDNANKIPKLVKLEAILLGKIPSISIQGHPINLYLILLIGIPFLCVFSTLLAFNIKKSAILNTSMKIIVGYILFNIFFMTMVINLVENGENNRMRVMLDPFFVVLFGIFIAHVDQKKI